MTTRLLILIVGLALTPAASLAQDPGMLDQAAAGLCQNAVIWIRPSRLVAVYLRASPSALVSSGPSVSPEPESEPGEGL